MDRSLNSLDLSFRPFGILFLARLVEAKIPVLIAGTGRTAVEQAAYLAKGTSKVKVSKHQSGKAIDIVPFSQYLLAGDDKLQWDTKDPIWLKIKVVALSAATEVGITIECGANYKPLNEVGIGWDPGHFGLVERNIDVPEEGVV